MRLVSGQAYEADISLGFFEKMASNEQVKSKLEDAGFKNVVVWGSGGARVARGVWSGPNMDAELPSQIKAVRII